MLSSGLLHVFLRMHPSSTKGGAWGDFSLGPKNSSRDETTQKPLTIHDRHHQPLRVGTMPGTTEYEPERQGLLLVAWNTVSQLTRQDVWCFWAICETLHQQQFTSFGLQMETKNPGLRSSVLLGVPFPKIDKAEFIKQKEFSFAVLAQSPDLPIQFQEEVLVTETISGQKHTKVCHPMVEQVNYLVKSFGKTTSLCTSILNLASPLSIFWTCQL